MNGRLAVMISIALVLTSRHLTAQGFEPALVILNNRGLTAENGAIYNAPITDPTGARLVGEAWTAELGEVEPDGSVLRLSPTTTFRSEAAAGFVNAILVDVPDKR